MPAMGCPFDNTKIICYQEDFFMKDGKEYALGYNQLGKQAKAAGIDYVGAGHKKASG